MIEPVSSIDIAYIAELERKMKLITENPFIPEEPTNKQWAFLLDDRKEILFGGAAGGGKSIALLMAALMYVHMPNYRALLMRRTYQDLILPGALMDVAEQWLTPTAAKRKKLGTEWHFPSGAKLTFGYMANEGQKYRYQGAAFNFIGWDETTQFTEGQYTYLFSRCRHDTKAMNDGIPDRVRCACVDEGDVLTEFGWKPIQNAMQGELVYSMNQLGELELKPVLQTMEYDVQDSPLVKVNQRGLRMSMTPNHRVVATRLSRHGKRYELIPFEDDKGQSIKVTRAPVRVAAKGWGNAPLGLSTEDYLALLGIFLAEGCTNTTVRRSNYKVIITQPKFKAEVAGLLDKIGINYSYSKNGDFQVTNKAWHTHFKAFGKAGQKFIPREILNEATEHQLRILFQWMMLGDGSARGNAYFTTSYQLSDDVLELGLKLGYKVSRSAHDDGHPNHAVRYTVNLSGSSGGGFTVVEKNDKRNDVETVSYTGKVYCLSVADNETFIIRQGESVWISGNSNPGGVGHEWVKNRFIDPMDEDTAAKRLFVPATLRENPHLDNTAYEEMLAELDPVTRAQLESGDWEIQPSGNFFQPKIRIVAQHASNGRWGNSAQRCRAWDLAATETGDYCVGILLARDRKARLWRIEDVVRVKAEPAKLEKLLAATAKRDGPHMPQVIEQESGSAGKLAMRDLRVRVFHGSPVFPMPATGNKTTRARLAASIVAAGDMEMAPAGWNSSLITELVAFPNDQAHDDQVDALSHAVHWLVKQGGADRPKTVAATSKNEVVTKTKRNMASRMRIIR